MCAVTLSDMLRALALTRLLFSALMIVIVDHRGLGTLEKKKNQQSIENLNLTPADILIQDTLQRQEVSC